MLHQFGPVVVIVVGNAQEVLPVLREVLSGQLQRDLKDIADTAGRLADNSEALFGRLNQLAQSNPPADAGKTKEFPLSSNASPNPDVTRANANMDRIDTATTQAGAAVSGIAARFSAFMAQIAGAPTLADAKALADRAGTEADSLKAVADSLTPMASDPNNPVPVEVPTPPAPPNADGSVPPAQPAPAG